MTELRLKQITLDKKIQPRVAISQDTINEYCQAHFDGTANFPDVVVFQDGNKYYLADGWHRYKAAEKAKITKVECEVRKGTMRDAIKYSLSANATHGLNRSNSDKRRAVMVCIGDDEWQKMSAREIAKECRVSHVLVNQIYKEIAEKKVAKEKGVCAIGGSSSTSKNKDEEKQADENSKSSKIDPKETSFDDKTGSESTSLLKKDGVYVVPEGFMLVETYAYEETMENYKEALDQNIILQKVVDADEPLKVMSGELKKMTARAETAEARMNGLVNEKNEAIRHVKARDVVIKKLKKQLVGHLSDEELVDF